MNPRTGRLFGAIVGVGLVAALLWAWRRDGTPGAVDGPIILISIDTLRADRLPAYGYSRTRTPQTDRLAADGVLFEQAYSHSPQTLPAHTAILSGRLPFETGVRDNIGFLVRSGERMVQHALGDIGFATGAFVSAYVLRHQVGLNQGFSTYDDELPAAAPDRALGQIQRAGSETATAAIAWIDRQVTSKLFLFFHIYEPHTPYAPPAEYAAADPYDGEVAYADAIVGRLLDHLRAKSLYDPATIILLSDHGEGLGDHGEAEHGTFLYRETIRVPLVIKLAGGRGAGRRVTEPVQHIDLTPTILEMAGAVVPGGLRGRSLRPVLEGSGTLATASIYAEAMSPRYHFGWSELYALTDDRYRLIRAPRDELFDLSQDPGETRSVVTERPQVRAAMRQALDALIANVPIAASSAISEEERRKLAALGYVGTQTGTPITLPGDTLPDPKDKIAVLQRYRRASTLMGEGRWADAADLFRELLREDPEMVDVWLQLAGAYERGGRSAAALGAYQEVIKRHPKDPASLTGAASILIQLGKFDDAREHAALAVDVSPAHAHQLLARIALEGRDASAARRHAQLAFAADPSLPMPAFVEGLILYNQGQFAAAIPHLAEASRALAARTEQIADVRYVLADALARLDRFGEAEPQFSAEIAVFPQHLRARAGLAMLYAATGRQAQADAAVVEIETLAVASSSKEAYSIAAQLWTMFGQPQRAAAAKARASR